MDQDKEDVRRVLEGDISAFENIVRRWQHPLINLAFRYCRDRQKAEEMAQDAFMRIYKKLDKFRGDSSFSTWVFAVNLNLYRSIMRRKSLPFESTDALEALAGGQSPQLEVEKMECEETVRRAVTSLPPRYRDAVIVFYFRETDLKETAAMLCIAVPAIWIFPAGAVLPAMNRISYSIGKWILSPGEIMLDPALFMTGASLLGTLILVWLSLRLAGADR